MAGRYDSYDKVPDSDLEKQHAGFDEDVLAHERPVTSKSHRNVNFISHLIAVATGIILCFVALKWKDGRSQDICTNAKLQLAPSLVPEELIGYTERVRYNGTLDYPSIYRGYSQEVEDAWDDVTIDNFIDVDISDEDVKEFVTHPETVARFPEKDGGGYVMTVEYTHQLHCLNLLRQTNPWNYPEYQKLAKEKQKGHHHTEEMFRTHIDHCTEMLRQVLMCHADTTPVFENWVTVRGHPWPNFNTVHQCRNFDAIHTWFKAHVRGSDDVDWVEWPTRPEGAKALATPP